MNRKDLIARHRSGGSLWQGGFEAVIAEGARFDVVVLCALPEENEAHLPPELPPHVEVIRAPNDDSSKVTREQVAVARNAAELVVRRLAEGKRVLVSCAQGRNRSGLVSGLVLHRTSPIRGRMLVEFIRRRRERALTNPIFAQLLEALP